MVKSRKNQNRKRTIPFSLRELRLALLACDVVTPDSISWKSAATIFQSMLVKISIQMGVPNLDPEVPDSYLTVLLPALISRKIAKSDLPKVLAVVNGVPSASVSDGGAGAASSSAQSTASIGADGVVTTAAAASTSDSWIENTRDWWQDTISGDFAGGWTNFQQGWSDFWSGNFK